MDNIIVINIWNRNTWRCSSFIFRCTRAYYSNSFVLLGGGLFKTKSANCLPSIILWLDQTGYDFFYYFQNIISKNWLFWHLMKFAPPAARQFNFFLIWIVARVSGKETRKNGNTERSFLLPKQTIIFSLKGLLLYKPELSLFWFVQN